MKSSRVPALILISYCLISLALFLYSYTQVDLNLTLSRFSIWQTIQKSFQYVGYYMRGQSTGMYVGIIGFLYVLYIVTLHEIKKGVLGLHHIWEIIMCVSVLLVLSYPAFSYDMFNYIFTAKSVLLYHKNPYIVLPQQFASVDPWINFMRWIHLPSAYTPLWILFTFVPYLLGFGYLLLILWNIKILILLSYLATAIFLYKILYILDKKRSVLGLAIFALNPLVLIEGLVNAHNDMLMMALAMISFYLFLQKKRWWSYALLSVSVAVKLMTIFLFPVFMFGWNRRFALLAMSIGFCLVLLEREVLPWYLIWILPFVALLPELEHVTLIAGAFSLGLLLRYAPYLYFGHWNDPVPAIKSWVTLMPLAVAMCYIAFRHLIRKKRKTAGILHAQ